LPSTDGRNRRWQPDLLDIQQTISEMQTSGANVTDRRQRLGLWHATLPGLTTSMGSLPGSSPIAGAVVTLPHHAADVLRGVRLSSTHAMNRSFFLEPSELRAPPVPKTRR